MTNAADWPISIMATQDVACGARLWNTGGQLRATLIVKATFALVDGGPMRLVAPAPLATLDEYAAADPQRSVLVPSDLVPYRPRGEVLFVGHAHAPSGQPSPSLTARLAVFGQKPLVDKSIHVFGERVVLDDGQTSQPVPFTRMPIVYERTTQSQEENPIGMISASGAPAPNLVDPIDPSSPAGFGAIAPHWAVRRRMLRALDPAEVEAQVPEIPAAFAWSYFQAAPPDQRCAFFEGNEWLVLDALHPDKARFESQLPSARASARLYASAAMTQYREFPLVADTLFIDGDRGLVCVVWRGNLDVDPSALPQVQALAGLELPGRPIPWPQTSVLQPPAATQAPPPSTRTPAAGEGGPARSPSMSGVQPAVAPPAGMEPRSPSSPAMPAVRASSASSPAIAAVQVPASPQGAPHGELAQMPARSKSTSAMPAVQLPAQMPAGQMPAGQMPAGQMPAGQMPAGQMPASPASPPTPMPASPPQPGYPPAVPAHTVLSPSEMHPGHVGNVDASGRPVAPTLMGSNAQVLAAVGAMPVVPVIAPPPAPHVELARADASVPAAARTTAEALAQAEASTTGVATITVARNVLADAIEASKASTAGGAAAPLGPLDAGDRDEPNTRIVSPAAIESLLADPMSEPGAPTIPRPIDLSRAPAPPESLNPTTMKRPRFDDPETFQPDSSSIARIVQEAEAQLGGAGKPTTASPPTMAAEGVQAYGGPGMGLNPVPTPQPMHAVQSASEAERMAAAARARADAAAAEGAALAREHISAGAMRKVRPPKTTIRGLVDPARMADSSPGLDEETSRANDPSTQRFDAPTTTKPGGQRLAELMQKADRGDFPPLDEPAPTRQFETASLAAALGALEAAAAPEPGATHTAISPVFPVRTVPDPGVPSSRKKPLSSPPERMSITNAIDMVALMRAEVTRRMEAGESLAGMSLEGSDLSNLDLRGRDLSGAKLRGASLRNAKLDGANLSAAVLDEVDLTRAALDRANLTRASLRAAIVNDASLRGVDATEASFEGAIGTSAALDGLLAPRALFNGARFDCARFDGATLEGADFTEAIIDGASFDGSNLNEARLYEARAEAASFVRATLTGARLDSSVLVRGRFQGVEGVDSLWDQAELDQASFEGAKLAGASFTKTSCRETNFTSADLGEARFNRSILWGARFLNVDITTANFDGADTRGVVVAQGSIPPGAQASPTGRPPGG